MAYKSPVRERRDGREQCPKSCPVQKREWPAAYISPCLCLSWLMEAWFLEVNQAVSSHIEKVLNMWQRLGEELVRRNLYGSSPSGCTSP